MVDLSIAMLNYQRLCIMGCITNDVIFSTGVSIKMVLSSIGKAMVKDLPIEPPWPYARPGRGWSFRSKTWKLAEYLQAMNHTFGAVSRMRVFLLSNTYPQSVKLCFLGENDVVLRFKPQVLMLWSKLFGTHLSKRHPLRRSRCRCHLHPSERHRHGASRQGTARSLGLATSSNSVKLFYLVAN